MPALLDHWVARAEGLTLKGRWWCRDDEEWCTVEYFDPSSRWTVGGPIIAREQKSLWIANDDSCIATVRAESSNPTQADGETTLIAAMRAYVASKYGDNVGE
jgi:hypothetical protein